MKQTIDISDELFSIFKKHGIMAFDYLNEYDKDNLARIIANGTPYNPSGDAISREALKKEIEGLVVGGADGLEHYYKNGSKSDENAWIGGIYDAWELINNAQPVPFPNEQIAWEQGYDAGLAQGKHEQTAEWRDNLIEVFRESAEIGGDVFHLSEVERIINGEPI